MPSGTLADKNWTRIDSFKHFLRKLGGGQLKTIFRHFKTIRQFLNTNPDDIELVRFTIADSFQNLTNPRQTVLKCFGFLITPWVILWQCSSHFVIEGSGAPTVHLS